MRPALLLVLLLGAQTNEPWQSVDKPAREFAVKDLTGRVLKSTHLAGKVVLVDFWGTWCGPCKQELPDLATYHERVKASKDVMFLSFNVTDDAATALAFVHQHKIAYPVYQADSLLGPYGVTSFPTKLVIDMRRGKAVIRFRRTGFTNLATIETKIAQVLAEKP